jgi:leucyl-tRNA---protein transferase
MKFFSSELGHEYAKTYTFGYCNYGILEPGDKLHEMYEKGYLPYSGSPDSKGMFYMARSGRLHLPAFELDSECRRVAKKFESFKRETTPFKDFEITDEWRQFWIDYFVRAHGTSILPRERLDTVLGFGIISQIGIYRDAEGAVRGYTLEATDDEMTHDWYQAWDSGMDKSSFGMYLLLDIARVAKERGAEHYYCGTVYGNSNGASYKTNLPGLEYWDGAGWIKDETRLKEKLKKDSSRTLTLLDEWKEEHPLF